jgi:hypothetical protein
MLRNAFRTLPLLLIPALLAGPVRADVLVTNYVTGAIERFDGTTGAELPTPFLPAGTIAGPAGITYNPADNLVYISAQFSNQILRYNLDGSLHDVFKDLNTFTDPVHPLPSGTTYNPTVLRFSPVTGDLYVSRNLDTFHNANAAGQGTVDRFNKTTGAFVGSVMTGMSGPGGLLFNSTGDLFGSSLQSQSPQQSPDGLGYVNKVPNGGSQAYFVAPETTSLLTPAGLASVPGGTGNIAVVDVVGGSVHQYGPAGNALADLISPGGALNGQFPSDVYFDPLGRTWVASIGDPTASPAVPGSVKIFDLSGPTGQTPLLTISGINASQFAVIPAVPEPGTLLLVGGAAVVGAFARRRKG